MSGHDMIVIGGSAGAVPLLVELARGLPADLPAALAVVVHMGADSPSILHRLLDQAGPLPAQVAEDGEEIRHGRIYLAPPDHHLLIRPGRLRVTRGPRENRFRPAVDPLFRTAAAAYESRVVGVVLSGGLNDGTHGLMLIKRAGGLTIVQEPAEAACPSMPASAIDNVAVDQVVPMRQMAELLSRLAREPAVSGEAAMARNQQTPPDEAEGGPSAIQGAAMNAPISPFTCPECGGALWELGDGKLLRYCCHVGHGFTAESLLDDQNDGVEEALWVALRALKEQAALRRRLAERVREGQWSKVAGGYERQAGEAEANAAIIRDVLLRNGEARTGETQGREEHARKFRLKPKAGRSQGGRRK